MLLILALLATASALPTLTANDRHTLKADIARWGYGHLFTAKTLTEAEENDIFQQFLKPAAITVTHENEATKVLLVDDEETAAGVDPATIISIGKDVWDLVKDNKPVVDVNTDWAGAVPSGLESWTELEGWRHFQSEPYNISFVNFVGARLTQLDWTWTHKYNGQYDGTGLYVTQAGAVIQEVYAYLTETVEVSMKAFDPLNYGTHSEPMAGIDLELKMRSYGAFEDTTVACHVNLRGDGSFQEVACKKGPQPCLF